MPTDTLNLPGGLYPSMTASELARLESGGVIATTQHAPPGVAVDAVLRCAPADMIELLTRYEEMPEHIFALERAEVLRRTDSTASVRFCMKLPFPIGEMVWTNLVQVKQLGGVHTLEWTLLDGDLDINDGKLLLAPHGGRADLTYARYQVRVKTKARLPASAERLATRWLVPKIVKRLRRAVETG